MSVPTPRPKRPPPRLAAGEEALRESGVPFTVLRPGGLTNGARGQLKIVAGAGQGQGGLRAAQATGGGLLQQPA